MHRRVLNVLALASQVVLLSQTALAAPPAVAPVLRVETGHHTQAVRRVSVDAAGRWLLTSSEDRTARLWSLPSGKLARTFRLPAGVADSGSIYAGALSPDGRIVVLSGLIDQGDLLYVVDRASGRVLKKIADLPTAGNGIFFSRDGKRIAVTFHHGGVRVYDTKSWSVLFSDSDYKGPVFGADFDAAGRLVTASHDGYIRLYGADGKQIAKVSPTFGHLPQSVRFSPEGDRVAIGFVDIPGGEIVRASNLGRLYPLDATGLTGGDTHALVWVGRSTVIAFGTIGAVRQWELEAVGPGSIRNFARPGSAPVLDIATLPNGSVVFGEGDGSWGILASDGRVTHLDTPVKVSYEGLRLKILPDAKAVRFAFLPPMHDMAIFSVADLRMVDLHQVLDDAKEAEASDAKKANASSKQKADALNAELQAEVNAPWVPTNLTDQHYVISNWKDTTRPTLDDHHLRVNPEEVMHALAIASDGEYFVLGSDWHLYAFHPSDPEGHEAWMSIVPASIQALNIGLQNKVIVTAQADGTIRWLRANDGTPLLAFFPVADRKRWVAWTPSGYYATAPGAESLVGFLLNKPGDQLPDFVPASRFAARLRRPEVVKHVLDADLLDEALAVQKANQGKK